MGPDYAVNVVENGSEPGPVLNLRLLGLTNPKT